MKLNASWKHEPKHIQHNQAALASNMRNLSFEPTRNKARKRPYFIERVWLLLGRGYRDMHRCKQAKRPSGEMRVLRTIFFCPWWHPIAGCIDVATDSVKLCRTIFCAALFFVFFMYSYALSVATYAHGSMGMSSRTVRMNIGRPFQSDGLFNRLHRSLGISQNYSPNLDQGLW